MLVTYNTQAERVHAGEHIVNEQNPAWSRVVGSLASGNNLDAGTVLGRGATTGAAVAAAWAGNTGDGAMGAITVGDGAKPGTYKLVFLEPGTNVGTFQVTDPDGIVIGTGVVASAFDGGPLAFTLADGATDFVAGDGFDITVTLTARGFTVYNQDGTDGSEIAAGVLLAPVDATAAAKPCVVNVKDVKVKGSLLTWPSDIEAAEKTKGIAQLADLGIEVL